MKFLKDIFEDINYINKKYNISKLMAFLTNRGIHSLIFYRISHTLYRHKIPLFPMILTRIIQITYAIDIDYKSIIEGGVIIIHGSGIVIGNGVIIKKNTVLYHQVTLGIKGNGINDGFPTIEENCTIGAGAKIFGKINIGANSIIGANTVVTDDIPSNSIVTNNKPIVKVNTK